MVATWQRDPKWMEYSIGSLMTRSKHHSEDPKEQYLSPFSIQNSLEKIHQRKRNGIAQEISLTCALHLDFDGIPIFPYDRRPCRHFGRASRHLPPGRDSVYHQRINIICRLRNDRRILKLEGNNFGIKNTSIKLMVLLPHP